MKCRNVGLIISSKCLTPKMLHCLSLKDTLVLNVTIQLCFYNLLFEMFNLCFVDDKAILNSAKY